ncbi:filamentous hemagglutinin N-terminal domain-containing protein [Desulfobacterales bacterium HSG2]|nr:filamentous hemagglutinin N-terminal domain-containing protein [Desulfobacterales bacterium HSG2]
MKFALQSVIIIFVLAITAIPVHSDGMHPRGIQLDGTLGNAGKLDLPGPNYDIKAEYGQQAGTNLFHSFHQFNIHSDETATFSGPSSVQNIISRVTGGDPSWIDGTLRSAISGADLYLLNPAGMMFGPNAALDLGGSFHASTADYLRLGENEHFYAMPPKNELLSVAALTAFGFLDNEDLRDSGNPGSLTVEGRGEITEEEWNDNPGGLHVSEGETISLIGGNIEIKKGTSYMIRKADENGDPVFDQEFDELGYPVYETELDESGEPVLDEDGGPVYSLDENGNLIPLYVSDEDGNPMPATETTYPGEIRSPGGRINLAGVSGAGEAVPTPSGLDVSSFEKSGNITVSEGARLNVSGSGGGAVYIRAGRFELDSSVVEADTHGTGDGRGIDLCADEVEITHGGRFASHTFGPGRGGDIKIRAGDAVTLSGQDSYGFGSEISTTAEGEFEHAGNGGTIELTAGGLYLDEGAEIKAITNGSGRGGDISIRASDTVSLSGGGIFVNAQGETDQAGNGGTIELEAERLHLDGGAEIGASTLGPGQAGNIRIHANGPVTLSGESADGYVSRIASNAEGETDLAGNGGTIELEAEQLHLDGGAEIGATTFGPGRGGNIKIQVSDAVTLSGESSDLMGGKPNASGISSNAQGETDSAGNGGTIELEAERLLLDGGAEIGANTFGPGRGGNIKIQVSDSATLSGESIYGHVSGIASNAEGETDLAGNGGTIELDAEQLHLDGGAEITASTVGPGRGGDIKVHVNDTVTLSGEGTSGCSGIYTTTEQAGNGGTIELTADRLRLTEGAEMSTSSEGRGDAGEIDLEVTHLELNNDASVSSESSATENGGDAGTITVNAGGSVRLTGNGTLTTEARGAGGGRIFVNAGDKIYLIDGEITSSVRLGQGQGGDVTTGSEFVILNRGGITANADEGDGGAIFIRTGNYVKSSDSGVTATSRRGNDGTVRIEAPDTDISSELVILPETFFDAARWMKTPCAARSGEKTSRFVIKGRDAVPTAFDDWQPSPLIWFENGDKDDKKTED